MTGFFFIPKDYDIFRCPHPFYHHDLLPNTEATAKWGDTEYPMFTNSLGFRDRAIRRVAPEVPQKRILFLGDSFLEGLAVPYEQSVTGVLQQALQSAQIEVLNAAVVSYSPRLYYLKTRYLLEERGLKFDELFVFIDISDIQNEIAYEQFEPAPFPFVAKIRFYLNKYFQRTSFSYYALNRLFYRPDETYLKDLQADGLFPCLAGIDRVLLTDENFRKAEAIWTLDQTIYEQFGEKGLQLARENMQKLVNLCQQREISMTLVVYPWPAQIFERDRESIQVTFWQTFAREHHLTFLNLFPEFINALAPEIVYNTYFIPGDIHWNVAGHSLVAQKILEKIAQ